MIRYSGRIMSLPTRSAASFVLALTRLWTRPRSALFRPDGLGDEERLGVEQEAELARGRLVVGLDQVQPDDLALVAQGDEATGIIVDVHHGRPAKDAQLVIGLLLLKHMTGLSDRELVAEVLENPYMQAFCGFRSMATEDVLDASTLRRSGGSSG